jgi:hypothetical protein
LVAGILAEANTSESFPAAVLLDRTMKAITEDESELVQVACIKAIQGFVQSGSTPPDQQIPLATAISAFLESKDMTDFEDSDDLLVTLVESLRAVIRLDSRICLAPGNGALDLLFVMAKHGASNFQLTMLVEETFEDIVESLSSMGPEAYSALVAKVLPSLTGAFEVGNMTGDDPLTTVSQQLMCFDTGTDDGLSLPLKCLLCLRRTALSHCHPDT